MTEEQWLTCTDPIAMLEYRRGSPTGEDTVTWSNNKWQLDEPSTGDDRKFRLFACTCCRRIWDHIPFDCNREAVVAVEDFLEGRLSGAALHTALCASSAVEWKEDGSGRRPEPGYWAVKELGRGFYKMTAAASAVMVAAEALSLADERQGPEIQYEFNSSFYPHAGVFLRRFQWPSPVTPAVETERTTQAALLRCIFGNPFKPAPAWLVSNGGAVGQLATQAYQDRVMPFGTLDPARLGVLADALEESGCTDASLLDHLRGPGPHVRGCWALDAVLNKS